MRIVTYVPNYIPTYILFNMRTTKNPIYNKHSNFMLHSSDIYEKMIQFVALTGTFLTKHDGVFTTQQ